MTHDSFAAGARDGAQAAALLVDPGDLHAAKVVLLDVGLPDLDGLSVLRELAAGGTLQRPG